MSIAFCYFIRKKNIEIIRMDGHCHWALRVCTRIKYQAIGTGRLEDFNYVDTNRQNVAPECQYAYLFCSEILN